MDIVIILENFALNAESQDLNYGTALPVVLRRTAENTAPNAGQKKLKNGTARIAAHQEIEGNFVLNVAE